MDNQIGHMDVFEVIASEIERAKTTPPSREFIEKQIKAIFDGEKLRVDILLGTFQALLELIEYNEQQNTSQRLENERNVLLAKLKLMEPK